MTGHARTDTAITAVNEGAFGFLTKPVKQDRLRDMIARAMGTRKREEEKKRLFKEVVNKYQETKKLSITDGLTGLYNNRFFNEMFKKELVRAARYENPLSLLLIDIDDFKKLNDDYGHLAGNFALKRLAGIFKKSCRAVDLPARWGGEEFAIILPETDKKNAAIFASRLKNTIALTPLESSESDRAISVTVSIGLASFPLDGTGRQDLIRAADRALYDAKLQGKNRVCLPNGICN